jgi:tetratricopeptide (TPR) repeat protein
VVIALLLALLVVAVPESDKAPMGSAPAAEEPELARASYQPTFSQDPALRAGWLAANRLEYDHDFAAAAKTFERLFEKVPDDPHLAWRIARNYALWGDLTRLDDASGRRRLGQLSVSWAERGLDLDPDCAECCLYKFAGMGLLIRSQAAVFNVRWTRPMFHTLQACLENPPTFVHGSGDHEAGNLYYAAARLYRLLPESRWARAVLGAGGDKELALEFSRRAFRISPGRIDYNAELAASSLCVSQQRGDPDLRAVGLSLLADIERLEIVRPTDRRERDAAARLAADPGRACGYSRSEWSDAGAVSSD